MSNEKLDLSDGVTFEVLDSQLIKDFAAAQKEYTEGFVRLQPYNQVRFSLLHVKKWLVCIYEKCR